MPARSRMALLALALVGAAATVAPDADAKPRRPHKKLAQNAPRPKTSSVVSLIEKAREMFDDQRYEESIQTLSGALVRPGTNKLERIEVYKLLAFNYITLGKNEEADAAVRAILVLDESFALPKTESPRFREFFDKTRKAWEDEGKPGLEPTGEPAAQGGEIVIKYTAPAQVAPGTAVKIEGTVEDASLRVEQVELYYRAGSTGKFAQKSLAYSMGGFRGEIPPSVVSPPLVEFYIQAVDKAGLPIASRGDADGPLRIAVPDEGSLMWYEHPGFWVPVGLAVAAAIVIPVVVTQVGAPESTVRVNLRE